MGFLAPAEPEIVFSTVATAMGRAQLLAAGGAPTIESWPKARLFVLEDQTAVLVTPAGQGVTRQTFALEASAWAAASRQLTVVLTDGRILLLDGQGCGCNMGAVGGAGPADGQYRLSRVRRPEWHTVER